MGRPDIAECGKRFSSEYQPARRGRPKGSLNRKTILDAYLRRADAPDEVIEEILKIVFPDKKKRPKIRG